MGSGDSGFGRPEREGNWKEHSEVLLSSLLGIHGIKNRLSFGSVALPELLNLPLHHGIQGSKAHLQLLKVKIFQLGVSTQRETDKQQRSYTSLLLF